MHEEDLRVQHQSARESAIYEKLKKGPEFWNDIPAAIQIQRESFVEEVRALVTPTENSRCYPLIVGKHGTGKTSLIQLAVDGVNKDGPKGIAYVDMPDQCTETTVVEVLQEALGWSPDPVIDSGQGNHNSSLSVGIFEANKFVATSVEEVLKYLSGVASKYRKKHKRVPVLIIDNVNRLVQDGQESILDLFQNYAKRGCDEGTVTVVFVSSEVPRRMMGKSIMLMVLFVNYYFAKLSAIERRSAWSRAGDIREIGDVSKEEALQYLELRNIEKEQAAQIHELVGGRMIHLKRIADTLKDGKSTLQGM